MGVQQPNPSLQTAAQRETTHQGARPMGQRLEVQAQVPADQTLTEKLATAETNNQGLRTQVFNLNQQLTGVTQHSSHYLQQIVPLKSGTATDTTPPFGTMGSLPAGGDSLPLPLCSLEVDLPWGRSHCPHPQLECQGLWEAKFCLRPLRYAQLRQLWGTDHLGHHPEPWSHVRWLHGP